MEGATEQGSVCAKGAGKSVNAVPTGSIGRMKPHLAPALAAALAALSAQEKPAAAEELSQLRSAFAAANAGEPAAVIAVVKGREPVIVTAGTDAAGKDLTPQTLVPLLALAKWLAADAIHRQLGDKIDKGSGEKLGERELTVRELLDGVSSLPEYYVLDGGDGTADAALLRKCGAMAAAARLQLQGNSLGAPEFVLLEPLAFGGRYQDWSTMLRSTLAPHVSGLDPLGADVLSPEARGRTILAAEDLAKLAAARPALLRTMLSLQNLGAWMQWRSQQAAPLWNSPRMGRALASPKPSQEQRWVTGVSAFGLTMTLTQYASAKAALLAIVPSGQTSVIESLRRAFEGELYEGDEEAQSGADRLRAGLAAARAAGPTDRSVPSALAGTRWAATTTAGTQTTRLAFGAGAREPLVVTLGSETLSFSLVRMGDGLRATPVGRGNAMFWLWLRPEPDAENPTKLAGVLGITRASGMASTTVASAGASVPQYFECGPEKE